MRRVHHHGDSLNLSIQSADNVHPGAPIYGGFPIRRYLPKLAEKPNVLGQANAWREPSITLDVIRATDAHSRLKGAETQVEIEDAELGLRRPNGDVHRFTH
jgi:hypothetical protein